MRCIDADELKKAIEPYRYAICGFEGVLFLIDNAPTVDITLQQHDCLDQCDRLLH